ncbi:MAG: hypothetical protein Q8K55_11210 [Gemmatimonadaceae bacterium]|nr:hypothetical protein [Gemmatimonadaceae bacterium]
MSNRSVFLALATLLLATPATLRSQEEDIDFAKARREYVAGQPRAAANSLLMASLGVRQQVGRCRDEVVGAELLNAESNLEKLANALRAGTVKDVKALDAELTKIDLFLAHHHLLLVKEVVKRPRADNIPTAARDLDRLAYHFERSFTLSGKKPNDEQAAAIADAQKLAKEIETSNAMPGTASATLALIEKQVVGSETTATK